MFQHGSNARCDMAIGELPALQLLVGSMGKRSLGSAFYHPDDDLAYAAQSSNGGVAAVAVAGNTVHVAAAGLGSATITITATASDGQQAEQTFNVTVIGAVETAIKEAIRDRVMLEVAGKSFSVDLLQLFPYMDSETTVTFQSNSPHVVAVRVRNQQLILVPGKNEGTAEVVVTATHSNGWQTTHRLQAAVEPAPRSRFRSWWMIFLHDAANDENDNEAAPAPP